MSGPLPKTASERRRRNTPAMPTTHVPASPSAGEVEWGEPDPAWHPMARDMFAALATSQQSDLAQPSDVMMARFACEGMTRCLTAPRFSATSFAAICDVLSDLGASLGSRLRLRLELESRKLTGAEATAARLRAQFERLDAKQAKPEKEG